MALTNTHVPLFNDEEKVIVTISFPPITLSKDILELCAFQSIL